MQMCAGPQVPKPDWVQSAAAVQPHWFTGPMATLHLLPCVAVMQSLGLSHPQVLAGMPLPPQSSPFPLVLQSLAPLHSTQTAPPLMHTFFGASVPPQSVI